MSKKAPKGLRAGNEKENHCPRTKAVRVSL